MPIVKKIPKSVETSQAQFISAGRTRSCGSDVQKTVELPQAQAQSEDRRCHSCDATRSTNHPVSAEDGVDSQCQNLDRGVDVRVDEATDFNDRDNAGVIVNVQGDEGFGTRKTAVLHTAEHVRVRSASERICGAPGKSTPRRLQR